ncbi:hypothetical protein F7725_027659 [Dissostichus mawsoni]|uniref:Geranylgeranyl transferase type-2 subunit alpha n=1 Tax=Dissostichus mawsoni TaxID=36200 RepID=A0A7J5XDT7_DISMA|nr:hypothetical protein F7725_027659 [Dissostichus mawsoni]
MSGVPVDQELAFTDRLIGSNFSNYSSWHYRSTLLPLLHPESPEPTSPCHKPPQSSTPPSPQILSHRVCEEQLLKEYELVQNAFFTDPNDQSAWFYYRWLLGRAEREEMISCVYVCRDEERVAVAFSGPVNAQACGLLLVLDGLPQRVEWRSVHPRFKQSPICDLPPGTISDIPNEHNLTVHWTEKPTHRDCALYTGRSESWCRDSATDQELFRYCFTTTKHIVSELSVEKTSVLQSELQSCNQLQELEPLNKWCLLTIILLMRALDPLGYEKETLAHFQTLKFMIENTILKMEYAEVRVFSISDKNLTTLCHLDQLLLVLEADNNSIENLEGVYHLPKLEEVILKNNSILKSCLENILFYIEISSLSDLQPLASCPKLKRLDLRGNPVTQTADVESKLAELLPSVTDLLL